MCKFNFHLAYFNFISFSEIPSCKVKKGTRNVWLAQEVDRAPRGYSSTIYLDRSPRAVPAPM